EFQTELDALRETPLVRYDQVSAVKGIALDALHRVFEERVRPSGDERAREYERYLARGGQMLTRFATWMAIAEREGCEWREWPPDLRDASGDGVARFAAEHASRVSFHCWLQFEADRQLRAAAATAKASGMRIGLYQDLAVGSSPNSA